MCGICGIIGYEQPVDSTNALIRAMCDVIIHRGPDEDGVFLDHGVALGMRRLKIIDLSSGSQPIFNEDKSVVVVFNGEIYNFQELRKRLERSGHKFYTNTDTEVLVHLYEDYGDDFLTHLNGMFGIALWDRKQQKLILARDRMGEKPLYYTQTKDGFFFGSELKSILVNRNIEQSIESEAVWHYFSLNNVPAPLTIYKDIYKLLPGECLVYQENTIRKQKYWKPVFPEHYLSSEEEVGDRLYQELLKAVKLRLISDVPLGAFLSGGIDSSIMVALMSEVNHGPVKTFSIGLEDSKDCELPFARLVAKRYGTDHHEFVAKPDALKLIDQLVWHFDEPFGDSSALPTFLVSQLTKKHVTVALSGDGGDELFGGYSRYSRILKRKDREKAGFTSGLSRMLGDMLPYGFKGKAMLQGVCLNNYDFFTVGTSESVKQQLCSTTVKNKLNGVNTFQFARQYKKENLPLLNQCSYFDLNVYLPDDIMTKVDRMSMANSLETRAPMLDHNLVEFALSIHPDLKIKDGVKKYILKKVFKKQLPTNVYTHQKTGFSIPLGKWYRNELRSLILDSLCPKKIDNAALLSSKFVSTVVTQHMTGKRDHKRLIWMILMMQLWHESWVQNVHPQLRIARSNYNI